MEPDLRPDPEVASLTPGPLSWSNALTSLRAIAAPFFFWALIAGADVAACLLFWLAVVTDLADGRLARARGEVTILGGLLDHATDAGFVVAGLAALALQDRVPALLPVLVVAAFLQYVLDSRILAGRALRTSALGRWNGILYFVPPGIVASREALGLSTPDDDFVHGFATLLVVSTIVSMVDRLRALVAVRTDRGCSR